MSESTARIGATTGRRGVGLRRRPSRWAWLVAGSAAVLAAVTAVLAALWIGTWETRTTVYALSAAVSRVELQVGDGDVEILGGGPLQVAVRRSEQSAYDQAPQERRTLVEGVLRIESRCPPILLGACAADYRLTVPDNVPVTVTESSGDVRMTSYRGAAEIETDRGDIVVDAFCGFALRARSTTGNVRVSTVCSPERLELRTEQGDVNAVVPAGRYRVDADATRGDVAVRGLRRAEDAPFQIQALSTTGNVTVEAAP